MTNEQTIGAIMDAVLASQDSAFRRGDGLEGYEESVAADQCVRDLIAAALAAKDAEIAALKHRLADSGRDLQAIKADPALGEWIEWNGGECPIADGTEHCVRLRSGAEYGPSMLPMSWEWSHCGSSGDIIAYRIIP